MSALLEAAHAKLQTLAERRGPTNSVILKRASDMAVVAIRWLWIHWLALGKLHVLAGSPGQGKTTIALAAIATITSGGRWPDGSRCVPGNALIWSGEDDPADTLLPRLIAMGADTARVFFIEGAYVDGEPTSFDPSRDMVQLAAAAAKIGNVKFLLVDPVVAAVTGDSHKNTEVRRALQPLVELAAQLDAAVLGISHFAKGGAGRDPTERVVGSVAFSAVARVVLVAAKVPSDDNSDRRILARSKSNIGPDDGGFEYSLEQIEVAGHPGVFASHVQWGASVDGTARELLAEMETQDDEVGQHDPAEFLEELLKGGALGSKQIKADAAEAGFAWRTVHRAADRIGVVRRKDGMKGGWYWSLSNVPSSSEGAEDASVSNVAPSTPSVASSGVSVALSDNAGRI